MIVVFAMKKTVTMSVHEKGYYETNIKIVKAWRSTSYHDNENENDKNAYVNPQQVQQDMEVYFDGYIGR